MPWHLIGATAFIKAIWAVVVVAFLAVAEPWWHQAVIVIGGSLVTGICVLGAALITARRMEQPLKDVKRKVEADRREGD